MMKEYVHLDIKEMLLLEKSDLMCKEGLFIFKGLTMIEYNTFNL